MNNLATLHNNNLDNGKILQFNTEQPAHKTTEQRQSPYKTDGRPKAKPADPIRSLKDIHKMQQWYLDNGKYRDYLLFTLGITSGLRAGDLLRLTYEHVFDDFGRVRRHFEVYEQKTGKRNRLAINSRCAEILTQYREAQAAAGMPTTGTLFPSRKKDKNGNYKPISQRQLVNVLADCAYQCYIDDIHISTHTLRKTFVYHSIKQNEGNWDALFTIQKMLNHSSFKTTLHYCGLEQDKADDIREGLAELF